ncbi:NAD(P)-dependent oxidoreductase [Actinotalea ferrariae CF5-4]|uniref:NAD(P)-dependent oxidoreductase n=1 Tax=Actinotalea ferrariae CF5-4 TaxID=948458 RepID=A0A021VRM9_9CELL|nr:NAD(P)-dependent oxidoreductase [Actinotalea ferrariae]EYR62705.1 NAD(P)-dependent oxidoreductase [Actinotalea ferrariae CF5-4]
MIVIDTLLAGRQAGGRPIRVALVGAGFMGRGLVNQIAHAVPGMEVAVIAVRRPEQGFRAFAEAGVDGVVQVDDRRGVERAISRGVAAVTEDILGAVAADGVDAVVDVTGAVELGAHVAVTAFEHGKHLVLMNAEVDATVGPELARRADAAGVVYTGCDGDQPGVQMNLVRFVRGLGLRPLVAGNIKGLQDPYRTPTTQKAFAERWGQDAHMVTSFADGTKISIEQATVANATGMSVHRRGMLGRDHHEHIDTLTARYDLSELESLGGAVDYVVGAQPGPGVYVFATHDDPKQRHYLNLYKLGEGPLYSFYTPYHLCHFEVPNTVARAVLLGDAAIRPLGAPTVEVVTTAKTDLAEGTVLDGLGGYHYYGQADRADVTATERLLPIGVAEGCRLLRAVPRDAVLTYDDVELPSGRLVDELRVAQSALQGTPAALSV